MLYTNSDAQSLGCLITEADYIVTDIKPDPICSYETGNSSACKTCHFRPCASTKGGLNKGGGYSVKYAPEADFNKTAEI